jgi:hypothetical protein
MRLAWLRSLSLGLVVAFVLAGLGARPGTAAPVDAREMQAREAFAAGQYDRALDLFVKLYAEKLHPNYLRNIGRCYQNLGQPDRAISSFREYLRKAKNLGKDERTEIQGYIDEMEALKKKTPPPEATAPAAAKTPASEPEATHPVVLAATDPAAGTNGASGAPSSTAMGAVTSSAPPPAAEASSPVYKKWWFWVIVGGAVAGGITLFAVTRPSTPANPVCDPGRQCL